MTGASEDLLRAVYGLRKAAEAQFTGNAYYQVANDINELIEMLGWREDAVAPGQDAVLGFATMLDEVRKFAKTGTSGSMYSATLYKLDELAVYLKGAAISNPKAAPAAVPAPAAPAAPQPAPVVAESAPAAAPVKACDSAVEPDELLQAAYGLRKAAEAEFTGNAYYTVVNEVDALIETLGWDASKARVGGDAAYGFATMISKVRKFASAKITGIELAVVEAKLNRLASILTPAAAPDKQPVQAAPAAEPANTKPVLAVLAAVPVSTVAGPTFDALAAASKARVEVVAESLGIVAAHHVAAPHEPEKRSSEPCSMPEVAPVEPVAVSAPEPEPEPAPVESVSVAPACPFHAQLVPAVAEENAGVVASSGKSFDELAAASKAQVENSASRLGIEAPHVVIAPEAVEALSDRRLESLSSGDASEIVEAAEPARDAGQADSQPHIAEAAPDLGSPAAEGEIAVAKEVAPKAEAAAIPQAKVIQPAEKKRKTLFKLWLDLAFGRKD
jgi:hypothetical protein